MSRIEPDVFPLSEPFWEATRRSQFMLQHCDSCDRSVWYPRERCPSCLAASLHWQPSAGTGVVYTFNIMRKAGNPMMNDAVPYVIALVDLDDGVRVTTNIVGCQPEDVRCGQRVAVDWSFELSDGRRLPMFRPL
jgi:uncharacterized OB-fold protein